MSRLFVPRHIIVFRCFRELSRVSNIFFLAKLIEPFGIDLILTLTIFLKDLFQVGFKLYLVESHPSVCGLIFKPEGEFKRWFLFILHCSTELVLVLILKVILSFLHFNQLDFTKISVLFFKLNLSLTSATALVKAIMFLYTWFRNRATIFSLFFCLC